MPVCPYENHRLRLDVNGHCDRCGGDLRLYSLLHRRAVGLFNEARRQWDASQIELAGTLVEAALGLREAFAEAHWLLGAVDMRRGNADGARERFERARQLGARVELAAEEPAPSSPRLDAVAIPFRAETAGSSSDDERDDNA